MPRILKATEYSNASFFPNAKKAEIKPGVYKVHAVPQTTVQQYKDREKRMRECV